MDSITHIALGACIGEAFFERGFGKKAMLWGALAQSIPDIDFIASFWMSTADDLLAHRGFTHSILFAILVVPVMAMAAEKIHRPHNISFKKWSFFFAAEVLMHLFLDGFNNYGVGWFVPFSDIRFSFNTLYVADPLFSIWPGIAFVVLLVLHRFHRLRPIMWKIGIYIPFVYLLYCTYNKLSINKEVKQVFAKQQIPHEKYFTTPTPLNNWLWYVVAGNDSGYYVGFRSVFDQKKEIDFTFFPKNDTLLHTVADHKDVQQLKRFSQGFYTVEQWNDTLVFNDLRFGQILGWHYPDQKFVFHYFLEHPNDNTLIVQRGRFKGWDNNEVMYLLKRIRGF
nr:metal-dependent hydrolase [uncultured Lacibacter sp.]